MTVYVDRIESDIAVLQTEDGTRIAAPASQLPPGCREGSMLEYADGKYVFDNKKEAERKRMLFLRLKHLTDNENEKEREAP